MTRWMKASFRFFGRARAFGPPGLSLISALANADGLGFGASAEPVLGAEGPGAVPLALRPSPCRGLGRADIAPPHPAPPPRALAERPGAVPLALRPSPCRGLGRAYLAPPHPAPPPRALAERPVRFRSRYALRLLQAVAAGAGAAAIQGPDGRLQAALQVQLAQQVLDVDLHGRIRNPELARDLLVAVPEREAGQDLVFPLGELGFVRGRRRGGGARQHGRDPALQNDAATGRQFEPGAQVLGLQI